MKLQGCKVLVTGGAGFIGSHLVDRLLAQNNQVVVIDDLSTGKLQNLAHQNGNKALQFERLDILDFERISPVFEGVDYVFHLATKNVRLSLSRPTIHHQVNVTGTFNVLKAATAAQAKRFLYCSSSEVNGTAAAVPMAENYFFQPETLYGASKLAGEYYSLVFHRSNWLETVIARPHNNYGPREHFEGNSGELIPRLILWALAGNDLVLFGDGKQTRDFTYVTETADYLVSLMECQEAAGEIFNVCRGVEVSIKEIAEIVVKMANSSSRIRHADPRPNDVLRLFGNPEKLAKLLGSSPQISIAEGLEKTLAWFKDHVSLSPAVLESMPERNWQQDVREDWMPRK